MALVLLITALLAHSAHSASSEGVTQATWEFEGPDCQGTPIMKHYISSHEMSICDGTTSASKSTCQQTTNGISSYNTTCQANGTDMDILPPGYLCRIMYEMKPDCSNPASIKQVNCFTLAQFSKCWKRSTSGFSVTPVPLNAGEGASSMLLAFDSGSLTSGKQYVGPTNSAAGASGGSDIVQAFDGADGSACDDGSCECSKLTVENGKCDGFGTKFVW